MNAAAALVFWIGGRRFAVETSRVTVVLPWAGLIPIPWPARADALVLHDGEMVVILPPKAFGVEATRGTRILVCTTTLGLVGIPADRIEDHAGAQAGDVRPLDVDRIVQDLGASGDRQRSSGRTDPGRSF